MRDWDWLIAVMAVALFCMLLTSCGTIDRRYDWSENNIGREFERQGII